MKHTFGITTLSLAAALLSVTAYAQNDSQSSSTSGTPAQTTASDQSSSTEPWKAAQKQEFFRASDLIGKNAQDKQAQKIGSIKDVVFNQQGEIFALVDVGSSRWAAVPLQLIEMRSAKGDKTLVLNSTKQAISSAPIVTKDQWGALNNPAFTQGIYSYYKVQSPAQSTSMGGSADTTGSTQQQGSSDQNRSSSTSSSQTEPASSDQPQKADAQHQEEK